MEKQCFRSNDVTETEFHQCISTLIVNTNWQRQPKIIWYFNFQHIFISTADKMMLAPKDYIFAIIWMQIDQSLEYAEQIVEKATFGF